FVELRRRAEKLAAINLAAMWRDQHVTGSQIGRHLSMWYQPRSIDALLQRVFVDRLVDQLAQGSVTDQEKPRLVTCCQHRGQDCRESGNAVPQAERARETNYERRLEAQLVSNGSAVDRRSELT